MTKNQKRIAVFLVSQAVAAALAWTGGYNFDHRDPGVALLTVASLLAGFACLCALEGIA